MKQIENTEISIFDHLRRFLGTCCLYGLFLADRVRLLPIIEGEMINNILH